jgi:phage-related protein
MKQKKTFAVAFFETAVGNQPVRDFLLNDRSGQDRKEIGEDIAAVQWGFPLGLPLVEKVTDNLWEIRSHIPDGICRTFFTVYKDTIILLHSFIKKTQKTPKKELEIAHRRLQEFRKNNNLR